VAGRPATVQTLGASDRGVTIRVTSCGADAGHTTLQVTTVDGPLASKIAGEDPSTAEPGSVHERTGDPGNAMPSPSGIG
jgi:hypothetical protein